MLKLTDIEIHPDDCLFSVSWSDRIAGELQQVVPGFVFVCFFSELPPCPQQKAWHGEKETDGYRAGLPLHFLLKKELERKDSCQFER